MFFSMVFGIGISSAIFCHASSADVKTDKATYAYGEAIKVSFSGAPGLDSDWIMVVRRGS